MKNLLLRILSRLDVFFLLFGFFCIILHLIVSNILIGVIGGILTCYGISLLRPRQFILSNKRITLISPFNRVTSLNLDNIEQIDIYQSEKSIFITLIFPKNTKQLSLNRLHFSPKSLDLIMEGIMRFYQVKTNCYNRKRKEAKSFLQ